MNHLEWNLLGKVQGIARKVANFSKLSLGRADLILPENTPQNTPENIPDRMQRSCASLPDTGALLHSSPKPFRMDPTSLTATKRPPPAVSKGSDGNRRRTIEYEI